MTVTDNSQPRQLRIVIAEAKELKANNVIQGASDPFTVFKYKNSTYKTEVIKNTLAPLWNYIVDLTNVVDSDVLDFEVFDWERIGSNKSIGKTCLTVADLKQSVLSGQRDRWLQLNKKGFLRITYDFTPPLLVSTLSSDGSTVLMPTVPTVVHNNYDTLPPPVHFQPMYIPNLPTATTVEFSTPHEIYQEKVYLTGTEIQSSVVYTVSGHPVWVRALYVNFKGKVTYRNKKVKTMVSDTRDLLHSFDGSSAHFKRIKLDVGKHVFPFQFYIPKECKSSIIAGDYSVDYNVTFYADTVNLPDVCEIKKIKVVNIEDTNFKSTALPINRTTSKSPLTGGTIEFAVTAPKNFYYPGEDIEMDVKVVNKSKKTIKNVDFALIKKDDRLEEPQRLAFAKKQFFPKVYKGSNASQPMVFELPTDLIPTTYNQKMIKLDYELWVTLDIPSCVDLYLRIPINIVFRDPTIVLPPNPLTECANIPTYIKDWNDRHVYSWLMLKVNAPFEVVTEFDKYNIQGCDIMTFDDVILQKLCSGAGDRSTELFNALKAEKYRCDGVRVLLKSLQLPNLIQDFENQCITTETLSFLTDVDLKELNIKIGDRKRILAAIKEMNNK